jgi:hypothetical protein
MTRPQRRSNPDRPPSNRVEDIWPQPWWEKPLFRRRYFPGAAWTRGHPYWERELRMEFWIGQAVGLVLGLAAGWALAKLI